jgi:hypothetical protein
MNSFARVTATLYVCAGRYLRTGALPTGVGRALVCRWTMVRRCR